MLSKVGAETKHHKNYKKLQKIAKKEKNLINVE
jgi:hypothetical protein